MSEYGRLWGQLQIVRGNIAKMTATRPMGFPEAAQVMPASLEDARRAVESQKFRLDELVRQWEDLEKQMESS